MQDAKDLIETETSIEAPEAAAFETAPGGEPPAPAAEATAEAGTVAVATPAAAAETPATVTRTEPIDPLAGETNAPATDISAETPARQAPPVEPPRATLIPFIAPSAKSSGLSAFGRLAADRRFQTGAAAACLALVAVVAGGATLKEAAQAQRASERLARAVSAVSARIDAVEAAKPRDEAAEIRKAVSEARGGLATSRDLSATIAQLNARLDRLEHEQQARYDKLGERVEHEAAARNAESQARGADLAARVEKLEKTDFAARLDKIERADFASRIDKIEKADLVARVDKVEKKVAAQPSPAPTVAVAPQPPAKETTAVASSPGVSNEVTGSIDKPHPAEPIRGWALIEMRNGSAIVESRQGMRQIAPGDALPGAGKVERFERRGREWVVVTDQGLIVQTPPDAYAPRVVLRRPLYGPYGGFGPGYGGYD